MTVLTLATENYSLEHQINSNPTVHVEQSSLEYLHTAFLLYEYKQNHTKKEYRALLQKFDWDKGSAEEKRLLRIAENYQAFTDRPDDLAVLPISVLQQLCSKNYNVLIEELENISSGRLTCADVLELIQQRREFLKSQNKEEKDGNWRAMPDGSRYYTFGKIMEDDHQTGVFTEKLVEQTGLSPQRIVRMAIADLYQKQQASVGEDEISSLAELMFDEENSDEASNTMDLESKQRELESMWQRDMEEEEEYGGEEYLEEPEERDFEFEDEVVSATQPEAIQSVPVSEPEESEEMEFEVVETKQFGAIKEVPASDAEVLADILRNAADYSDVRQGLWRYRDVKEEAWKMLSDVERKSVCQMLPEPIKKLGNAKREGLIANFYEQESGGVYQIFTADCPLIEQIIGIYGLDNFLEGLRIKHNRDCN